MYGIVCDLHNWRRFELLKVNKKTTFEGMNVHEKYIQRCLEIAQKGLGNVSPNPMVGSVIVYNDKIIGEGYHQKYGGPHAEVNAINSVSDKSLLNKSTIYVSLEPCNHFGKTPPCSHLIVKHKIPRVVVANIDPFAAVNGTGIKYLEENGIEVIAGILEQEAAFINRRFFTFHNKKRPYIILKWAQTQDGFMDIDRTDNPKTSYWITTPASKRLSHQWRSEEDGILVGFNTVKNDNPSLTTREVTGKNPTRIVIDRKLDLQKDCVIFDESSKTIVINEQIEKVEKNIHYKKVNSTHSIHEILTALYEEQIQSVIIEGGKATLQQFIDANLWNEARVLTADKTFNQGLKAPLLQQKAFVTEKVDSDTLHLFYSGQ